MLAITPQHKVYLAVQPIDFRCGIDSLSGRCRNQLLLDPLSGHCFIFRNRRASAIKLLLYDTQGFWLCTKRLSKGSFRYWPKTSASLLLFNSTQLHLL
jgi:transposase